MEKPISMIINETKKSLISTCNDSRLPMCILEMIVKDLYNEIYTLSNQQSKQDEIIYKEKLNSKKEIGESKE